jgi:ribosomal protein S18 acetylase RimI-like enzyme
MNPNPIQLRQANETEASLLLEIMHAAFEEYRGRLDPPSGTHAETIESVQTKLKTSKAVIAFVRDETAGCVFYEPKGDHLYLSRLSVLQQFRKLGIGRALIDFVEAQAVSLKVPRVQLGVRIALPHLKAYYEQLGYRLISYETHPGYTQPTYVTMEKDVKAGAASWDSVGWETHT